MSKNFKPIFFILLVIFVFPKVAYAYIDPGTGSIIIQFIIGAIFGGIALIKIFWHKLSAGIRGLLKRNGQEDAKK